MVRLHLNTYPGMYTLIKYNSDSMKITIKYGIPFWVSLNDFKCFAGGRNNKHTPEWFLNYLQKTINNKKAKVKLYNKHLDRK